jgi:rod shape-determining protein MreB
VSPLLKRVTNTLLGLGAYDLGIDLGTANTLVYVRGKGIELMEPSVVAVKKNSNPPVVPNNGRAVGFEAKRMIDRTPANLIAIRPMKDGVIADFDVTEIMLRYFIHKVHKRGWGIRPRVLVSVPSGITSVGRRAVKNSVLRSGARKVYLIPEPKAAAIGAGLPISEPIGTMIIDIGGGTTEVAVLSLGDIVTHQSLNVAGDEMDEAIIEYIQRVYGLAIGPRMAEEIKMEIGSAYAMDEEKEYEVRGKDIAGKLPRSLIVTSQEIREAIKKPIMQIVEATKACLDKTPPELASDLLDTGITIAGGGALIPGVDRLINEETGLPTRVAEDPLTCVACGTGYVLDRIDEFESVLDEEEVREL